MAYNIPEDNYYQDSDSSLNSSTNFDSQNKIILDSGLKGKEIKLYVIV